MQTCCRNTEQTEQKKFRIEIFYWTWKKWMNREIFFWAAKFNKQIMQFLMKKVITLICRNYGENVSITLFIFIIKVQQVKIAQSHSACFHSLHTSFHFRVFKAEKKFQVIVWMRNDCLATRQFSFQGDADIFVIGQRIKSFTRLILMPRLYIHTRIFLMGVGVEVM